MQQWTSAICLLVCFAAPAFPQKAAAKPAASERRRKILDAAFYKKWLTEDVGYIVSDEERMTFKALLTDAAREQFVEQFWRRRDPTPDTIENEYREEYYGRLAYANEQFAAALPGWKTDRGSVYIKYGPPDEREQKQFPSESGTIRYERWHYRYIENFPPNVDWEFIDATGSGEFRLDVEPPLREALLGTVGTAQEWCKQEGPCKPTQHYYLSGTGTKVVMEGAEWVGPPKMSVKLPPSPVAKFKDLEAAVNAAAKYNLLPIKVQTDFIPVTGSSVLSSITVQFDRKDLQFQPKGEISSAAVNLYARITPLSRRQATWFEDVVSVDVPTSGLQQPLPGAATYSNSVPLQPGRYRLNIAAKDTVSGKTTNFETILDVPTLQPERLGRSSLILADRLEKVPVGHSFGSPFVIGGLHVRPRVGATFTRGEKLGMYLQLYNFEADEKTQKADGTVEYVITKNGSGEKVFEFEEDVSAISGGAAQVVVQKLLPLQGFAPGQYTLKIKVVDKRRNQTLTPSATFTVT